jgi:uncharacterized protein (TIGR00369 family)
MEQKMVRERIISWSDPMIAAGEAQKMSGLEFLKAVAAREIPAPPIAMLLSMHLAEASEGEALFILEPDESHYNPIGSVHGGVIATACDSAASCAVHSLLPAGTAYTTLEMKVNYIRPITHQTGTIYGRGKAIQVGRRIGTAEARLEDAAGKLHAHATVTCLIFEANGAS